MRFQELPGNWQVVPVELVAQGFVKAVANRVQELGGKRCALDDDVVAVLQFAEHLHVAGNPRFAALDNPNGDADVIGQDDRPVRQRLGRHGHQHQPGSARVQYRAVGGQRVGGRAGRRRNDQPVGALVVHIHVVDFDLQFDHAGARRTADDDVVQRQLLPDRAPSRSTRMVSRVRCSEVKCLPEPRPGPRAIGPAGYR